MHSAFAANGYPKELNASTFWLITLESISIIGVNVFIFISGYFSIKLKPKTIYAIVFICAFYFLLLTGVSLLMGNPFKITNLLFVSNSHGFIFSYLCVVMVSPMLNTFAEKADQKTFFNSLLMFFIFQTYFTYLPGIYIKSFHYGYGVVSYSFIYLIARYIRIYGIKEIFKKYSGTIYLLSTILLICTTCIFITIGYSNVLGRWYAYNNPIIIVSSISFFLFFERIQVPDNKNINHIAKSTLAVLLIHASIPAAPIYKYVKSYYRLLATNICIENILIWFAVIAAIFFVAVIVDQPRIYLIEKIFKTLKK